VQVVVIGDIHAQAEKLWMMLEQSGLANKERQPTDRFEQDDIQLVLLGDLVHAKSRERYSELISVRRYDEYNPDHLKKAEKSQVAFLTEVKSFYDAIPAGKITILMGNHDFNAIKPDQGPLRTDDVTHLEWKQGYGNKLPDELREWIVDWPYEKVIEGLHMAHVGPLNEHNTYDNDFYLENRRRWIYEERDLLESTPYRLGVYGHTPVRGGVNIASQGRAILLDTNGYQDEYCYLEVTISESRYRLRMHGLFFDEWVQR
jgi:hypothetical protein